MKAKRAALEQKIKFSDAIEEQQRVLNKLKLQQESSETIAEEAVREEALQIDERPFDRNEIELPKETTEQLKHTHGQSQTVTLLFQNHSRPQALT